MYGRNKSVWSVSMDTKKARIILTALAVCQTLFNLIAEVNYTHVFNYSLDGHARFHIVWQLMTDTMLVLIAVSAMWGWAVASGTNGINGDGNGVNVAHEVNVIRAVSYTHLTLPTKA